MKAWIKSRIVPVVLAVARDSAQDRVNGLAAEVAFFSVLSAFPAMLVLADALGSLEAFTGATFAASVQETILNFLREILTERGNATIAAVERLFARDAGGVATFATLLALVSLSRAFAAVIRALDLAYDVEERRSWIRLRVIALGSAIVTVLLSAVMLAAFVVGPLFGSGERLAERIGLGGAVGYLWVWLRWPVSFALLVSWATTLYHVVPDRRGHWKDDLPGAMFASVGWLVASLGLSAYLRIAGSSNLIFGVLGGGLILLVWLYLLALALLLGAELNGVLGRGGDERARRHPFRRARYSTG
ncbi:MAG TPA: YihY/virulence factor BrkB family protein [Actinomycetota bacterium]|nr:YihY/virulence factor BrkB family protein [Actinomycetota bacterium]